jgi:hypothetical protein
MMRKRRKRWKGGRKRVIGVPREANGRISRRKQDRQMRDEMTADEAKRVVLEARRRHTGLPDHYLDLQDAGRPNAGTLHGIMHLRGELDRDQWRAAEWYLGRRSDYLRAIGAPAPEAYIDVPPGTGDPDRHAAWASGVMARWAEVMGCIRDAWIRHRQPLASALDLILVRQQYLDHMVRPLRIALDALDERFLRAARARAAGHR